MAFTSFDFSGQVVLVTGAASGIGRATAVAFAKSQAKVVVSDVSEEGGLETVRQIQKIGGEALFVPCDVSQSAQVQALMKKIIDTFGRLDSAFNNAGIEGPQSSTADYAEEAWDRVIDTNLKGVWLCMKYQIPIFIKQGHGNIVNCSSIAGMIGFQGVPAYVASKHGILGLTKTAALEYSKQNIRVNAVCPGVIETPMIERFTRGDTKAHELLVAGEPMGRVGHPAEIAQAVLWLSSSGASFVTGHPLVVDGGWVAQ